MSHLRDHEPELDARCERSLREVASMRNSLPDPNLESAPATRQRIVAEIRAVDNLYAAVTLGRQALGRACGRRAAAQAKVAVANTCRADLTTKAAQCRDAIARSKGNERRRSDELRVAYELGASWLAGEVSLEGRPGAVIEYANDHNVDVVPLPVAELQVQRAEVDVARLTEPLVNALDAWDKQQSGDLPAVEQRASATVN